MHCKRCFAQKASKRFGRVSFSASTTSAGVGALTFSVVLASRSLRIAGFGATILRDIPFAAVYFLSYETLKDVQMRAMRWYRPNSFPEPLPQDSATKREKKLRTGNFFLAGAGAAACAVTLTMPMDVVKTVFDGML
jgi:hypothetical protein